MENEEKKYSDYIREFLCFVRDAQEGYMMNTSKQGEADNETQDLLHNLELNEENTYHDMAKISKALKQIRKDRRIAKNKAVQLLPIATWANENAKVVKDLQKLLGEVRKVEKRTSTEGLYYIPKTDVGDILDNE